MTSLVEKQAMNQARHRSSIMHFVARFGNMSTGHILFFYEFHPRITV